MNIATQILFTIVNYFVIHWLFQNTTNENRSQATYQGNENGHQNWYQRETMYDKSLIFAKSVRQKSQKGGLISVLSK